MRLPRTLALCLGAGALLVTAACGGDSLESQGDGGPGGSGGNKGSVTISGQNFTEMEIMAAMYDELLSNAGYDVTSKLVKTRDVYIKQLKSGDVDLAPEYLAGIADYLNKAENGANAKPVTSHDPQATLKALKSLAASYNITMLDPSKATDQNAFAVTKEYANKYQLATLSDLGNVEGPITLAAAPDCPGRQDCAAGLKKVYGINISKVLPLGYGSAQTIDSVKSGESQLGEVGTTQGNVPKEGLMILQDDQGIQPAQNLIPAVNSAFLDKHQDVADLLNKLAATLTTKDLIDLNGQVDLMRKKPTDVAQAYLKDKGLI
ncbi:MAG: glycine betaine ABC transporter substrate-binding protein [Nocardioidaceae bacterium]